MARYADVDKLIWQVQNSDKYGTITKQVFISLLQNSETADVAPVIHAHWIDDGYYADFHPHKVYRCSNCDWSKLDVELPEEKCCPNCGAKMDEVI